MKPNFKVWVEEQQFMTFVRRGTPWHIIFNQSYDDRVFISDSMIMFEVPARHVMQYSRCIDTNGVDIYEGDRLLIESEEEPYKWKTYVKSDGLFSVEVCGYDYDWTPLQLLMEDNSITNVEVIGNNLEELKEESK